ncbi:hypothetical protein ACJX0J_037952, partial [Zea mays]
FLELLQGIIRRNELRKYSTDQLNLLAGWTHVETIDSLLKEHITIIYLRAIWGLAIPSSSDLKLNDLFHLAPACQELRWHSAWHTSGFAKAQD